MKNKNKEVTSHNESKISGPVKLLVISHQKSGSQTHVLTGDAYISYIPHPCTIWKNVCFHKTLTFSYFSIEEDQMLCVRVQYVYEPYFIKWGTVSFDQTLIHLHCMSHLDIFQIKNRSWTITGRRNQLA